MKVIFKHDYSKEYYNFKYSFSSKNHTKISNRQQLFFEQYQNLNQKNAEKFARQYIVDNNIEIAKTLEIIEKKWREIEKEYNRRASKIFRITLPQKYITAYLTIMHELWHFYFHFSVGQDILKKFGQKTYNDIKEALTVLLNEVYKDLLAGVQDNGYPQHKKIREEILKLYRETDDIYKTINSTLKNYKKL